MLVARIRANLAQYARLRQGAASEEALTAGALRLEPRSRKVFLSGNPIDIIADDFKIIIPTVRYIYFLIIKVY